MKKVLALLTALVLMTLTAATIAAATEVEDDANEEFFLLGGQVTGFGDGYVTIISDGAEYQVNLSEDVIIEGTEALAVGDWLQVVYNGQMTRSLPPQVSAQVIRSYSVSGVVSDLTEGSFTITTEEGQVIVVNFDAERFTGVQDSMNVTVWFDGMMTRSLPAQITAGHIRLQEMNGTVVEITDGGFLMIDEFGMETLVHVTEETVSFTEIELNAPIRLTCDGTATMSIPAQIRAVELLPALDAIETPAAYEEPAAYDPGTEGETPAAE